MELKQTGCGVKIALAAIFAVLVVGYEVFVAIHLITAGHFPGALDFRDVGDCCLGAVPPAGGGCYLL